MTSTSAQQQPPTGASFWCAAVTFLYLPVLYLHGYRALARPLADFPSFYLAAQAVLGGQISPYDIAGLQALAQAQGIDQRVFPFLYPPPSLVLMLPLGTLSYARAALLFMCLSHLALLVAAWFVCRRLLSGAWQRADLLLLVGLVYFFAFFPTLATLDLGQNNLLVLACVSAAWVAMRERRGDWIAGVLLALACLSKLYLVLLLGALLVRGRTRVVMWSVATLGGFAALSLLLLPHSTWHEWLTEIAPSGGYGRSPRGLFSAADLVNQSLAGFIARLFRGEKAPLGHYAALCVPLTYAAAIAVLAGWTWALLRARRRPELSDDFDAVMSLTLLTVFLVAPFSWDHHLSVLSGVTLLALCHAANPARTPTMPTLERFTVVASAILLAWEIPMGAPFMKQGIPVLLGSVKCAAVFALWWSSFLRVAALRALPAS